MNIAIALNEDNIEAIIPETIEEAAGILIVDAETMEIGEYYTDNWVDVMIEQDCEAILCGNMYDPDLFESIADEGITRFYAANLTGSQAIEAMNRYQLANITDYVGGTGCGSHDGGSCEGHDHGDEE